MMVDVFSRIEEAYWYCGRDCWWNMVRQQQTSHSKQPTANLLQQNSTKKKVWTSSDIKSVSPKPNEPCWPHNWSQATKDQFPSWAHKFIHILVNPLVWIVHLQNYSFHLQEHGRYVQYNIISRRQIYSINTNYTKLYQKYCNYISHGCTWLHIIAPHCTCHKRMPNPQVGHK